MVPESAMSRIGRKPIPREYVVYALVFTVTYIFSLIFLGYYTGGDQVFYTRLYEAASQAGLGEMAGLQSAHTGSAEPLFGFTIWVAAHLVSKIGYIAFANSILVCLLLAGLKRLETPLIFYPFVFTNYYLFVLLLSAERLKFAGIALLAYGIVSGSKRYLFLLIAPLFHFQAVLFGAVIIGEKSASLLSGMKRMKLRTTPIVIMGSCGLAAAAVFLMFQDIIAFKFGHYSGTGIAEVYKSLMLAICGIVLARGRDRYWALFTFLPLILVSYIFGDERVNIVTFTFFLFFALRSRRPHQVIAIIPLAYFSLRGVMFLSSVHALGTGFPG